MGLAFPSSPTGTKKRRWRKKVMWAAGMSEKSKVTRNIFTTVWLGLNKVWGQDRQGWWGLRAVFLSPLPLPLRENSPLGWCPPWARCNPSSPGGSGPRRPGKAMEPSAKVGTGRALNTHPSPQSHSGICPLSPTRVLPTAMTLFYVCLELGLPPIPHPPQKLILG